MFNDKNGICHHYFINIQNKSCWQCPEDYDSQHLLDNDVIHYVRMMTFLYATTELFAQHTAMASGKKSALLSSLADYGDDSEPDSDIEAEDSGRPFCIWQPGWLYTQSFKATPSILSFGACLCAVANVSQMLTHGMQLTSRKLDNDI